MVLPHIPSGSGAQLPSSINLSQWHTCLAFLPFLSHFPHCLTCASWGHLPNTLSAWVCAWSLSHVWLFATPRTVACQALLSMGFSRQVYWSRLPFPPAGDLPDPGIKPTSPILVGRFFITESPGKPKAKVTAHLSFYLIHPKWWLHCVK